MRRTLRFRLHSFLLFIYLKLKKKGEHNPKKTNLLIFNTEINKMDHHIDQPSSHVSTHSDELQLAVPTQQNKRITRETLPFEVEHYRHQDELKILLNTAKQLKCHCFTVEQQLLLSLPEKASQVPRTAFLSYLVEIYGSQLTKGSVLLICDPLTNTYTSLIYDTLFNPLFDTLFEFFNGVWSEIQPLDKEMVFRKTS